MAAVTICSDFGAPQNKVWHCFHCFPIYLPWRKIASAITDKGVPTEPDATFDTMEQNIRSIPSGGDTLFGVDIPIEYGYLEYDSIDIELEAVSYTPDQYLVIPAVGLDS